MSVLETKSDLNNSIDRMAEAARRRHITGGDGQVMAYLDKSDEAADYKAAGYPADLSSYPFVQAEVNATGKTNQNAADDILTERSNWIAAAASIEEERLSGKKAVNDAATIEDAVTAHDAAVTALQAL